MESNSDDALYALVYVGAMHEAAEKRIEAPSTDIADLPYQGEGVTAIAFTKSTNIYYVDAEWITAEDIQSREISFKFGCNGKDLFVITQPNNTIYPLKEEDRVITWKDDHYETIFTPPKKAKPE